MGTSSWAVPGQGVREGPLSCWGLVGGWWELTRCGVWALSVTCSAQHNCRWHCWLGGAVQQTHGHLTPQQGSCS